MNSAGSYVVDAARYLDLLQKKQKIIREEQASFRATGKHKTSAPKEDLSKLSDPDYLANLGYIDKKSSQSLYRLSESLLRQEAVAFAMRFSNNYVPESYTCRGIFWDVSARRPNSWACRTIENALER